MSAAYDPTDEHDEGNVVVLDRDDDMTSAAATTDSLSYEEMAARLEAAERLLGQQQTAPDDDLPSLIVPRRPAPMIDLSRPEDSPDLPDGEWSKRHLVQFLARQDRTMVFIPKENWEPKGEDAFQIVGYQGHWFRVRKGRPESVPIQIGAIIEHSQEEFATMQSQAKKRVLTDITDLAPAPGSLGVPGHETYLNR